MPGTMRIAFQGEPGAYSEAALLAFDPEATPVPCKTFEEVFQAVQEGRAARGILPMENSIGGSIHRNYDLLVEHELPIVGEVELKVEHCLMVLPGVRLEDIQVVHSHPQALAQCERFLKGMANVEISAVYDTAGGAKLIREGGLHTAAAIASRRAAEVYALEVLQEGLQDFDSNITRFFVLSQEETQPSGDDKTSIMFKTLDKPGALAEVLAEFQKQGVNLTHIDKRPAGRVNWTYTFFIDAQGHRKDANVAAAVEKARGHCQELVVLGSYPRSKRIL